MSLLSSINEPGDLLKKLIREANSINFEDNEEHLSDLAFNFSVTCHSLRDWCIKSLGNQSNGSQLHSAWNQEKCLQIARDIANSSKHFGITRYTPTVKSADKRLSKTIEFREHQNIPDLLDRVRTDEALRNSLEKDVQSYRIEFVDGTSLSLGDYILQACRYWISFFDSNGIPRDNKLKTTLIYIAQSHWAQLA